MKLFYREMGQGEPVIILHGLFGMSDNWLSIGRRIAEKYHVFLPDQRNHGQSPNVPAFNYDALADDLNSFIKDRKIDKLRLIGHSMGGKVAMIYALRFPQDIKKLVIVDISPKAHDRPYFKVFLRQMLALNLEHLTSYREADEYLAKSIKNSLIRQFLLKNLSKDANSKFSWKLNPQALYNNVDEILKDVRADAPFKKSALFVRGGKSDYIPEADIPEIKKMFPAARIRTIAKAGHWVHSQAPDELCDILRDFL